MMLCRRLAICEKFSCSLKVDIVLVAYTHVGIVRYRTMWWTASARHSMFHGWLYLISTVAFWMPLVLSTSMWPACCVKRSPKSCLPGLLPAFSLLSVSVLVLILMLSWSQDILHPFSDRVLASMFWSQYSLWEFWLQLLDSLVKIIMKRQKYRHKRNWFLYVRFKLDALCEPCNGLHVAFCHCIIYLFRPWLQECYNK